jgi:hypothetical protein
MLNHKQKTALPANPATCTWDTIFPHLERNTPHLLTATDNKPQHMNETSATKEHHTLMLVTNNKLRPKKTQKPAAHETLSSLTWRQIQCFNYWLSHKETICKNWSETLVVSCPIFQESLHWCCLTWGISNHEEGIPSQLNELSIPNTAVKNQRINIFNTAVKNQYPQHSHQESISSTQPPRINILNIAVKNQYPQHSHQESKILSCTAVEICGFAINQEPNGRRALQTHGVCT